MRFVLVAILTLGVYGNAWGWDDEDYPVGGIKKLDEREVEFGLPSLPMRNTDGTVDPLQMQMYLSNRREYDEALGRLQIYNQRNVEKLIEQQGRLIQRMEEKELWEDIPRR